jgi:hypothetical protein
MQSSGQRDGRLICRLPRGSPPPAQLMTRINEMPMTMMMVPVTTGGKSGKSLLMKGAARKANKPAAITEPHPRRTDAGPSCSSPTVDPGNGFVTVI